MIRIRIESRSFAGPYWSWYSVYCLLNKFDDDDDDVLSNCIVYTEREPL